MTLVSAAVRLRRRARNDDDVVLDQRRCERNVLLTPGNALRHHEVVRLEAAGVPGSGIWSIEDLCPVLAFRSGVLP